MNIDIRKTAIRMRLRGLALAFIFSTLILVILLTNFLNQPAFGIGKAHVIIFLAAIYLLMVVYNYMRDYHYIFFSDDSNKIILRFYSMHPLSQAKRSIEIPRGTLLRFEVKNSLMGLNKKLVLFQKVKGGVYKYPAVSITALSQDERMQLLQALNRQLS